MRTTVYGLEQYSLVQVINGSYARVTSRYSTQRNIAYTG